MPVSKSSCRRSVVKALCPIPCRGSAPSCSCIKIRTPARPAGRPPLPPAAWPIGLRLSTPQVRGLWAGAMHVWWCSRTVAESVETWTEYEVVLMNELLGGSISKYALLVRSASRPSRQARARHKYVGVRRRRDLNSIEHAVRRPSSRSRDVRTRVGQAVGNEWTRLTPPHAYVDTSVPDSRESDVRVPGAMHSAGGHPGIMDARVPRAAHMALPRPCNSKRTVPAGVRARARKNTST
jgi:hypothetical protein